MAFAFGDLHVHQRALDFAVNVIEVIDKTDACVYIRFYWNRLKPQVHGLHLIFQLAMAGILLRSLGNFLYRQRISV